METSTKNKAEGMLHQLKGKVKKVAGIISDSPKMQAEGTAERIAGEARIKIGQFNQFFGK